MAIEDNPDRGIDWAEVELGNREEMTSALWIIYHLLLQEEQRREQALALKAPEARQDRVTLMGVY